MITPPQIVLAILLVFVAISLACAVRIGRRRPPAADPFSHPFGDVVSPAAGAFVASVQHRTLHERKLDHPVRPAIRADQGSGGNGNASQGAAAARTLHRSERRAR
jgi:hypothetical protein